METTPQLGEIILPPEQQEELDRLQHGVAVLDLFSKEVKAEDERADFLRRTARGSESREAILQGPSYKGDEFKLQRAVNRARGRYRIYEIRREAMLAHATLLGVPATVDSKRVIFESKQDERRVQAEHGAWRRDYASRHRTSEREARKEALQGRIDKLTGRAAEGSDIEDLVSGPGVSLEDRALLLTRAINAMAYRSMISGFDVANVTERHQAPIWERYEDGTPYVHEAAKSKRERALAQVRRDFWKLSGFAALRASGLMPEHEIRARSRKMYEEFLGQFEHPQRQWYRVKVRKQLKKYLPEDPDPETANRAA